nr:MAG TPA: hypothetical protein [Caudoviricetes sp.]
MTKQERIEELTEVIRKVQMENFRQSRSTYTSPEQIAKALCDAGYRKINRGENEVLEDAVNNAVDATFRGAVLRLAEKLKERIRDVVFISKDEIINWDILIDETAQKFLERET